jgi:CDP-diacylglycerol--glycerol-3-phosphate 3-phosphatidyltransferase
VGQGPVEGRKGERVSADEATWVDRIKVGARTAARSALDPVVRMLVRLGVHPDVVTWAGLLVTIGGASLFARGHFRLGALVATLGCVMDSLDGALARARNGVTRWGAFLDSTTDRIADGALFLGVAAHYAHSPVVMLGDEDFVTDLLLGLPPVKVQLLWLAQTQLLTAGAAVVALVGAYLVSYTRARMEGLGVECRVGWFERPERLVVLLGAGFFGAASGVMPWALLALAVLSFFTAFQRIAYARTWLVASA